MLARMFGLGMGEIIVILAILTVLFGATKLPQLGDGLGKAIRGFKKAVEGGSDDKPKTPLGEKAADAEPASSAAPSSSAPTSKS
jgi:sec-independent protein translocase protein TatA